MELTYFIIYIVRKRSPRSCHEDISLRNKEFVETFQSLQLNTLSLSYPAFKGALWWYNVKIIYW